MKASLNFIPQVYVPVGDMHVRKQDIADATRFIQWLAVTIKFINNSSSVKAVPVFMGDQYHEFGVAKAEAQKFWKWAYNHLLEVLGYPSISLVGNHDMNQELTATFMVAHEEATVMVDSMMRIGNVGFLPFIRDEELFYKSVMELYSLGVRKVFCHVEFQGSQYENGYYAPHGFDLSRYPSDLMFYSGHIHMKQAFGNVVYFGTPRHMTRSDIGEWKGIHLFDVSKNEIADITTPPDVWPKLVEIAIDEDLQNLEGTISEISTYAEKNGPGRVYVTMNGSKEFCRTVSSRLPAGVRVSTTYTDTSRPSTVKESEGIPTSFGKYAREYFELYQVPTDVQKAVMEKIYEACPSLKIGVR